MAKIYSLLATLIARLRTNDCLPDPVAMLSPRDWADLPTYHPAAILRAQGAAQQEIYQMLVEDLIAAKAGLG